jgi:hypothetical protein
VPVRTAAAVVVGLLFVCQIAAQTRPNFAGKWSGGRPMANLVGVIGPQEMVIAQSDAVLTIDRPYGQNRASVKVKLDGTPSTNVLDPGGPRGAAPRPPRELISTATWEGSRLKIATVFMATDPSGAKYKVTTVETLSIDGGNLVVERSDEAVGARIGQGGPLREGMIQSRKDVYKSALK